MTNNNLEDELIKISAPPTEQDGKRTLTCRQAWEIADKLSIDTGDVGKACDKLKIRICDCRLGCFE